MATIGLSTDVQGHRGFSTGCHIAHHRPSICSTIGIVIDVPGLTALSADFFFRFEALAAGMTDRDLAIGVRSGVIIRLRHGAYVLTSTWVGLDPVGRHLLLARSVAAAQRTPVALAGISAAAAHGFLLHDQNLEQVHLIRLDGAAGRTEAGIVHHVGQLLDGDIVDLGGLKVTSGDRTVWDVARMSGLEAGVVTADSALRLDPSLALRLPAGLDRYGKLRGVRQARITLSLADGRAENGGESVCRVAFHRHHVPMPDLQFDVFSADGEHLGRSDFSWELYRHLGEFDGKEKYERYARPGETAGDSVFREKGREDLMRGTRRGMSRLWWSIIMPPRVAGTMRALNNQLLESRRLFVVRP